MEGQITEEDQLKGMIRQELVSVLSEAGEQSQDEVDTQNIQDGMNYPHQQVKDNFFLFLRDLIKSKKSDKFGNLSQDELGGLPMTVRGYQDVAKYLEFEGKYNEDKTCLDMSSYFNQLGEIELATSLSKKGFFLTNAVTTIKKTVSGSTGGEKKGWSLFGKAKKAEGEE